MRLCGAVYVLSSPIAPANGMSPPSAPGPAPVRVCTKLGRIPPLPVLKSWVPQAHGIVDESVGRVEHGAAHRPGHQHVVGVAQGTVERGVIADAVCLAEDVFTVLRPFSPVPGQVWADDEVHVRAGSASRLWGRSSMATSVNGCGSTSSAGGCSCRAAPEATRAWAGHVGRPAAGTQVARSHPVRVYLDRQTGSVLDGGAVDPGLGRGCIGNDVIARKVPAVR